jgi:hypothetical protein
MLPIRNRVQQRHMRIMALLLVSIVFLAVTRIGLTGNGRPNEEPQHGQDASDQIATATNLFALQVYAAVTDLLSSGAKIFKQLPVISSITYRGPPVRLP